jgi:PAS domain S-box-containing protein
LVISVSYSIISSFLSNSAIEIFSISILVAMISIFPIRLPNRFFYTFDFVPMFYILLNYGWSAAIIPAIVSLLALDFNSGRRRTFKWFRFLVNLGCLNIAALTGYLLLNQLLGNNMIFLTMFLFFLTFDLISFCLNKGIQISVLGTAVLTKPSYNEIIHTLIFIVVSTIITYQIYQTETLNGLVQQCIFFASLLYIFAYISKKYIEQVHLNEESQLGYEMCFDSADQVLITIDINGIIENSNSRTAHILGYPKSVITGTPLWDIVIESTATQEAFNRAVTGLPQQMDVDFKCEDKEIIRLKGVLVPYTRNKKVSGVYYVGRTLDSEICQCIH